MKDELTELLDTAIYKEIASEALYSAAQNKTQDEGAKALLKELAAEEAKHARGLKVLKEKGREKVHWHRGKVPNLKISEYLTGADTLEGAGLQDTLIYALKREQEAVEFYTKMMGALRDKSAKGFCQKMVHEELRHKLKLEIIYDELFYEED